MKLDYGLDRFYLPTKIHIIPSKDEDPDFLHNCSMKMMVENPSLDFANAAKAGNPAKYHLPIPKVDGLDFSFSGIKTAVLRAVQKELNLPITTPSYELQKHLSAQQIADFAASFQATAVDILIKKLEKAAETHPAKSVLLAGGVSANQLLREELKKHFEKTHQVYFPEPKFSTDNGAMVASAAFFSIQSGEKASDPYQLDISPRSVIQ